MLFTNSARDAQALRAGGFLLAGVASLPDQHVRARPENIDDFIEIASRNNEARSWHAITEGRWIIDGLDGHTVAQANRFCTA